MWQVENFGGMLNETEWPKFDEAKCQDSTVEIVVQINGKIRCKLSIAADIDAKSAIDLAKSQDEIAAFIDGKTIIKEIYVPKKLVNIVVKP
jgi:leucyl-tRNA synthetase